MRVTNKIKAEQIAILGQVYKDTKPALRFGNPFELLVAVILSAQCTDVRVNITTERLFAKAPTPQAIIDMGLEALEAEIQMLRNAEEIFKLLLTFRLRRRQRAVKRR